MTKPRLTEIIRHFVKPSFVDMTATKAIVRFGCADEVEMFIERQNIDGCSIRVLNESETQIYFDVATKRKTEYKEAIKKKRHQK
jgi:hypothetical protein